MPARQRRGLDEEPGLPPGAGPASEEHEERPIRRRHAGARDAPAQADALLAPERVLGEQLRPPPSQVSPASGRLRRRQRPGPAAGAERATQAGTDLQKPLAATANEPQRRPPHE